MAIRKTGAVTGQVIGVEQDPEDGGITATAARVDSPAPAWAVYDEAALTAENGEADQE